MYPHESVLARLYTRLTAEFSRHQHLCDGSLLSITLATPDLPFAHLPRGLSDYRFWSHPESRHYLLGLGRAACTTASGEHRLQHICTTFRQLREGWTQLDPDRTGLAPCAFSAFAFDPHDAMQGGWKGFPNTVLEVPSMLMQRQGMTTAMTFTCRADGPASRATVLGGWLRTAEQVMISLLSPSSSPAYPNPLTNVAAEPDDEAWLGLADRAVSSIRAGALRKVVLGRRISVRARRRLDAARVVSALAYRYPGCTLLAADGEEGTLVAASPERLVSVRDGRVASDAIAGTASRSANEALDIRLAHALLGCAKSRHEHDLVVNHIADALAPLCTDVSVPTMPEVLGLRFVQHLWSPLAGQLRSERCLLDLLHRLHPTPAVGGTPTDDALAWLDEHELLQRGWYTGAAGWVTANGDGDFAVMLRCALIDGHRAELYAGAGIVADSDPAAELEETELKLQTMLDALQDA
jgi:isochorismate synthase